MIFLGVVFGAIGYYINKDTGNVYEIQKGIIFGAVYPLIMPIVLAFSSSKILDFIITCFYIYLATIIPNYVGIIILFIFIFLMILADIYFLKKDRTKQVNNIYENQKQKIVREQMNEKLKKEKRGILGVHEVFNKSLISSDQKEVKRAAWAWEVLKVLWIAIALIIGS